MEKRKPTTANISKDELPIAFTMLYRAFETALTHIAETAENDDWQRELYDRIQRELDEYNALFTTASRIDRDNVPAFQKDMPGAVRAGSATVDAAFDSVITTLNKGADEDPGVGD